MKTSAKSIDLSIIVVSYNTRELLRNCLSSVFASLDQSQINCEVIVVDNASSDGSMELVKKNFKQVHLLVNKENIGFGAANNQGIKVAKNTHVLLLNSDIVVQEEAILKLFNFYASQPEKSIVGGKLFNTDGSPQSSAGPSYTLPVIFTALFLKGDHLRITRYSPDTVREVDWVMGACIMTSKAIFGQVGYFDEGIFMYMEEIDFQKRAQEVGVHILFFPEAHFTHVGSGSSKGRETPILNVFRGLIYYYQKHYRLIANVLLRVILVCKAILAIMLFFILGKKSDRMLYQKALKVAVS